LVLGGDQDCAGRDVFDAAIFEFQPTYCFQKPDGDRAPQSRQTEDGPPAEQQGWQAHDHQNHEVQIKEGIEEERSRYKH
jgi:hypothetical protein